MTTPVRTHVCMDICPDMRMGMCTDMPMQLGRIGIVGMSAQATQFPGVSGGAKGARGTGGTGERRTPSVGCPQQSV